MKRIFAFLLSICILLGCTGCGIINQILETRARRRQDLFNLVNEIEKSPDFAMINYSCYLSTSEKIEFASLVQEKIKEDGKKINESKSSFTRYEGDIIEFLYLYKKDKRFLGINNKNNHYAVGTISLVDYSISIQYFKSKYERIDKQALSNTYHYFEMLDTNKENKEGEYISGVVTIDRTSGEVQEWKDSSQALERIGEKVSPYSNPKIYTENGIEYTVNRKIIQEKDNSKADYISVPSYSMVMEKSEEMRRIIEILSNEETKYRTGIEGSFFTNGTDLFVGFFAKFSLFSYDSDMTFPIVFKCDSTLEHFDYVGCINMQSEVFYKYLEVRRI